MRCLVFIFLIISISSNAQWKSFVIGVRGDTLNRVDQNNLKQGPWVTRVESLRGEPGYEEQGIYKDGKKEGTWNIYDPQSGAVVKTEEYILDQLVDPKKKNALANGKNISDSASLKKSDSTVSSKNKPKEVLEYEKKNANKKKIKVRDGATGVQ